MSTDQPTLDDYTNAQTTETDKTQRARYGRSTLEADDFAAEPDQRVCLNCEKDISAEVARVAGDNNGCIPRCADCIELRGLPGDTSAKCDSRAAAMWRARQNGRGGL